jgi:hypothetical protein
MRKTNTLETFLARLVVKGDCLEWTGHLNNKGYGMLSWDGYPRLAHRVAALLSGKISDINDPIKILHRCDNPKCCKSAHLFTGTQIQNLHDAIAKGRSAKGETHGHSKLTNAQTQRIRELYKEGNLYQWQIGKQFGVSKDLVSRIVNFKVRRG